MAKANATGQNNCYKVGDSVRHGKFGIGMVIEEDDKTVTVMFESEGVKKLAKGFAPLQKL